MPAASKFSRRDLAALARSMTPAYGVAPQRLSQAPAAISSHRGRDASPSSAREYQLFDIFRSATAPSTAAFMPSQFWTREILQLAHSEPAVWHAVVGLAALHCRWHAETVDASAAPDPAAEAEAHYHDAVSLAQSIKDPARALPLSLALGAAANLMGRPSEGRMHVTAGREILSEVGRTDETAQAIEMLARMDLGAMSISDANAPYQPQDAELLRFSPADFETISSHEQAASGLLSMMRLLMVTDEVPSVSRSAADKIFADGMRAWQAGMTHFDKQRASKMDLTNADETVPALSLRLYHSFLHICKTLCSQGPETRYDAQLPVFSRMIVLAEGLARRLENTSRTVTMEPGLVMALFAVGSKCRHPRVRRRAMHLLRRLKRQEGLWRSDASASMLKRAIEVEEGETRLFDSQSPTSTSSSSRGTLDAEMGPHGDDRPTKELPRGGGEDLLEEDRLREALDLPWEAWAETPLRLPELETWDNVMRIPEQCRIMGFTTRLAYEQRRVTSSLLMSSGKLDPPYRAVREEEVLF